MDFTPDDRAKMRSYFAREAANARHGQSDGAKEKHAKLIAVWKSGKYTSKNICAEEECAALGMSFHAARRALYNV